MHCVKPLNKALTQVCRQVIVGGWPTDWIKDGLLRDICRSRKDGLIDTQNQVAKYLLLSSPNTCEKRLFGRRWEHDGLEGYS